MLGAAVRSLSVPLQIAVVYSTWLLKGSPSCVGNARVVPVCGLVGMCLLALEEELRWPLPFFSVCAVTGGGFLASDTGSS